MRQGNYSVGHGLVENGRKYGNERVDRERGKGIIQLGMGWSKMGGNTGG
jgi:hypothetical protein